MTDWPVIQVYPQGTPSDAELEADRDKAHQKAVRDYNTRQDDVCVVCGVDCYGYCSWPTRVVG